MYAGWIIGLSGLLLLGYILFILGKGIIENYNTRKIIKSNQPLILTVEKRFDQTEDLFSFDLKPNKRKRLPKFQPGQYLTLEIPLESGQIIKRAYSLANWNRNPIQYSLGIKREENGKGSSWCNSFLQDNITIKVQAPKGEFVLEKRQYEQIVLIGGGIGITPMRSMLNAIRSGYLSQGQFKEVHLFYSARYENQLMYHQEFIDTCKAEGFYYHPILSRPTENWKFDSGRLTAEMIEGKIINLSTASYYMCAGAEFMDSLKEQLELRGINENQFKTENFGLLPGNLKELNFDVVFNDSSLCFVNQPTLYHALEDNGFSLSGDCRTGTCGKCKSKLLQGSVDYLIEPEADLAENEILLCCSRPAENCIVESCY